MKPTTDPADALLAQSLAASLTDQLAAFDAPRRHAITLLAASSLAESTAFALAQHEPPQNAAALILISAELDRHAQRQMTRAVAEAVRAGE